MNPDTSQCDIIFPEPVVAYGHDNIKNLGHSMSDFMNVWTMLSLAGEDSKVHFIFDSNRWIAIVIIARLD